MDSVLGSRTNATLLEILRERPLDKAAWDRFVDRYGPRIYGWCRAWHLQEQDACDVTQDVLLKLVVRMKAFDYDPARSFRGWLKVLTRHAWVDFLEHRKRAGQVGGDSQVQAMLQTVAAGEDLVERVGVAFDLELFDLAKAQVQHQVEPESWRVFQLTDIEGRSSAEVAKACGKTITAVYQIRSRIRKQLRIELRKLEGTDPEGRRRTDEPLPIPGAAP
ncbi:MAG: sigma-70 family RNA polymerase sigma factor [Planctomycetaceae bacterium]|nr:sigma-70 family RNA polymerase sigma factor [Planctomycetaceae bacterium]